MALPFSAAPLAYGPRIVIELDRLWALALSLLLAGVTTFAWSRSARQPWGRGLAYGLEAIAGMP